VKTENRQEGNGTICQQAKSCEWHRSCITLLKDLQHWLVLTVTQP